MTHYSVEPRTRRNAKGYGFLSFTRNISDKYGEILLDAATKAGVNVAETAAKKVVHKIAEATGEYIGIKITGKFVKPKPIPESNSRTVEEIVFLSEKRQEILN